MREIRYKRFKKNCERMVYVKEPSFLHYCEDIRFTNTDALRWINNTLVEKLTREFDNGQ